ncbi:hypothetical protein NMG60_11026701 [Bertholletia excelsa]
MCIKRDTRKPGENMSYWNCLLSKKGPLGTIWVASHCFKRVKKDQIARISIISSVDKLSSNEVPVFTYRVLGYLLLGVVRIYSKKVENLFNDCQLMLVKVNNFLDTKKANILIDAISTPYMTITRPKSFELDAFDLPILEDERGANVRSGADIFLADKQRSKGSGSYLFQKYHSEEDAAHCETFSTAYTTIEDGLSLCDMDDDMASPPHNLSNTEASIEKLRQNVFSLEECLDPIPFCEIEEEPGFLKQFDVKYKHEGLQSKFPDNKNDFGAEEECMDPVGLFHGEQHTNAENIKTEEMISSEKGKCQDTAEERSPSITIDTTPLSKRLNSSDATIAVQTPAAREPTRITRKRKCLFDDVIVLPNKVLKESIHNSSNLVCKRNKAPHTAIGTWKLYKLSRLPQTLLEPLIAGISSELTSVFSKKIFKSPEAVETVEAPAKLDKLTCPTVHKSMDEEDIAPSTPIASTSSLRLHELCKIRNSGIVGPTSSFESWGKRYEDEEFDISLVNEERNFCEGDKLETNEWAGRTRTLARYLGRSFCHQKTLREDESVNFLHILRHKTRSESAKLFYEILVLQTGGYIHVKQHAPYADILVLGTVKLKQSCEVDEAS